MYISPYAAVVPPSKLTDHLGNSEEDGNQTSADYHVIHGVIA